MEKNKGVSVIRGPIRDDCVLEKTFLYRLYIGTVVFLRSPLGFFYPTRHFLYKKRSHILTDLLNSRIDAYTLTRGTGYYDGESEDCFIVDILSTEPINLIPLIAEIKKRLHQDSVYLTRGVVDGGLI